MKTPRDNQTWISMIYNPNNDNEKVTGLDTRLLRTLIQDGHVSKDILREDVEVNLLTSGLPPGLRGLVKDTTHIQLWAAWMAAQIRPENNYGSPDIEKTREIIKLFHENDIIPWATPITQDKNNPFHQVLGFDVLFYDGKIEEKGIENIENAYNALSDEEQYVIKNRLTPQNEVLSWCTCAEYARTPFLIRWLGDAGISKSKKALIGYDPYESASRKVELLAMVKSFGTPNVARRHVLRLQDSIQKRLDLLDDLDAKQDVINGNQAIEKSQEDQIINLIASGSSAIEKLISNVEKVPVHRHGDGMGITILVASLQIGSIKQINLLGIKLEEKYKKFPKKVLIDLSKQEAAGMPGSGLSEMDCMNVGFMAAGNRSESISAWADTHLESTMVKLANQTHYKVDTNHLFGRIAKTNPEVMKDWIDKPKNEYRASLFKEITVLNQEDRTDILDFMKTSNMNTMFHSNNMMADETFYFKWNMAGACLDKACEENDIENIEFFGKIVINMWTQTNLSLSTNSFSLNNDEDIIRIIPEMITRGMEEIERNKSSPTTKQYEILETLNNFLGRRWTIEEAIERGLDEDEISRHLDNNNTISTWDCFECRGVGMTGEHRMLFETSIASLKQLSLYLSLSDMLIQGPGNDQKTITVSTLKM